MLGSSDKHLSEWEATFVKDLMDNTNHPEFAKIKYCNIKMTPRAKGELEKVAVKCGLRACGDA